MLPAMRLLAISIVTVVVAGACGSAANTDPLATAAAPTPTTTPTALRSPTTSPGSPAPLSAGAVAEAGIVYVWGADDGIYRYDGGTGKLLRIWGASTLARDSANGPY